MPTPGAEAPILRDLATAYPNITAIRVRDAIARVTEALGGIAAATSGAAGATLLTGFVVLIGAAAAGERARVYEAAVLKTLGATRGADPGQLRPALGAARRGGGAGGDRRRRAGGLGGDAFRDGRALRVRAGLGAGDRRRRGAGHACSPGSASPWRPLAARPARVLRARE